MVPVLLYSKTWPLSFMARDPSLKSPAEVLALFRLSPAAGIGPNLSLNRPGGPGAPLKDLARRISTLLVPPLFPSDPPHARSKRSTVGRGLGLAKRTTTGKPTGTAKLLAVFVHPTNTYKKVQFKHSSRDQQKDRR